LNLEGRERAVLGVLMLRGAQTLGEIRTRTTRLAEFGGLSDVESTLNELEKRDLVAEQPRRPGQKEMRYVQLLGGPAEESVSADLGDGEHEGASVGAPDSQSARIATLEATVDDLQRQVGELRGRLEEFQRQFA
jgi:hypothetical protein